MAKKEFETVEPVYTEEMLARVNVEENHHEVILRGEVTTVTLRNVKGTKGFKSGRSYLVSFTELPEVKVPPTDEEIAAAKAVLAELETGVSNDGKGTDTP